jgi:hypothetical protein
MRRFQPEPKDLKKEEDRYIISNSISIFIFECSATVKARRKK